MAIIKYLLVFLTALIYIYAGYFMGNANLLNLALVFIIPFGIYFYFIFYTQDKTEVNILLWISMLFRLIFLCAVPLFSVDYLRYLWDGKLLLHGFNPYLFSPADILANKTPIPSSIFESFFDPLSNEQSNTSIFPLLQLFTVPSAFLAGIYPLLGLVMLRLPILIADFVLVKMLISILQKLNLSYNSVLIYALNPLVIIGLTGNINFVGIMLCLLIVAIYLFINNKLFSASFFWAIASITSVFPLFFIPLLMKKLTPLKFIIFCSILVIVIGLAWLPFMHSYLIDNLTMFQQANSTRFGLIYALEPFTKKPQLILYTLFAIVLLSIAISRSTKWSSIVKGMLFCMAAFVLLNSHIEPYYFVILILLSVLVKSYHFAIVWSFLGVFSYASNFVPFEQYYPIMALLYSLLLMVFLIETLGSVKQLSN